MGIVQKDAFRTTIISYIGILLGYINKGFLFLLILSTEQIGLVNLMVSVGTLFSQFANVGAIYTTWKFFPFFKNAEKRHYGFLPLVLSIVLVGILICTIFAIVFREQIESLYVAHSKLFIEYYFWILPIGISYVLFMILEVYLRNFYKNVVPIIALEIVLRLSVSVLLFLLWFKIISFNFFVIAHSIAYLIPTLILIAYLYQLNELNFSFSSIQIPKRFKKILIQFSVFNYINTLGIVLVNSLDVMMIAQFIGLKATGVYTTIVFLTSALSVPYKSIIRISSPLVAEYWKSRELEKMKELYQKVSSVALIIGFGSFVWIWMNIDFLFSFLKPEFKSGIWVFLFLMMGRLVDMFFGLNGSIFSTSKKYKFDIIFTLILIVTVFILNTIYIPLWGIAGAAISTSIALLVYNIGRIIFVWYIFKIHPFTKNQFIIIGLGIFTLFVGITAKELDLNKWIQFALESVLFIAVFLFPIYYFKIEPEVVNYVKKGSTFLREKVVSKK